MEADNSYIKDEYTPGIDQEPLAYLVEYVYKN